MADYSGKVYRKIGGDELVIASGGKLTVEAGATVTGLDGAGGAADASDVTVAAISGVTGTDVQAVLAELAGRIATLEAA